MDAGFLDVLHDAGNESVLAVAKAIDVDLDGAAEVAVDEQRAVRRHRQLRRLIEYGGKVRDVAIEIAEVAQDLHGATAQHVGRTDHQRVAELVGHGARFAGRAHDPAVGLLEAQPLDQRLEAVPVLGEVDGVGRGSQDRHPRLLERLGELERRLPAELHDDTLERAFGAAPRR